MVAHLQRQLGDLSEAQLGEVLREEVAHVQALGGGLALGQCEMFYAVTSCSRKWNWLVARPLSNALLVDIGSTTTDIIPFIDGRDKNEQASAGRLARMVGEDAARHEPSVWRGLACDLRECQLTRIGLALARQYSLGLMEDVPLVGAGVGLFLVRRLAQRLERPYLDLSELIETASPSLTYLNTRYPDIRGPEDERVAQPGPAEPAADCAPATAVALLAAGSNHATID